MRLQLKRTQVKASGVFGELTGPPGLPRILTLEHAYPVGTWWEPKVAAGVYTCIRHAPNRLKYETFLLEKVPDFQGHPVEGILIHVGNNQEDTEGCILVGVNRENDYLTQSQAAFRWLMNFMKDEQEFTLEISGLPA